MVSMEHLKELSCSRGGFFTNKELLSIPAPLFSSEVTSTGSYPFSINRSFSVDEPNKCLRQNNSYAVSGTGCEERNVTRIECNQD